MTAAMEKTRSDYDPHNLGRTAQLTGITGFRPGEMVRE
jgi:hypothetical protein